MPVDVLTRLKEMGHTLDVVDPAGATNAIHQWPAFRRLTGVSEPRLEGKAAGTER
jgi:gamma-glutamyltranspeptidase